MKKETISIHGGYVSDPTTKAVAVPIYQTVAYEFDNAEHGANLFNLSQPGNIYTRIMNPTCDVLEKRVAALEGGAAALALASGSSAVSYTIMNLAEKGDNIVTVPLLYGGTHTLFKNMLPKLGIDVRFAESDNWRDINRLINKKTKAVYIETVGNPSGNIPDIEKIAAAAHKKGVVVIADNTVGTPVLVNPIDHGVDIVIHSLTKYIGGHGNTIGGVVVDSGKFPWGEHKERYPMYNTPDPSYHGLVPAEAFGELAFILRMRVVTLRNMGASLAPMSAFMIMQGMETLSLRMERHTENAMAVAKYLEAHPKVEWVSYGGLKSSPYYKLARKYVGGKPASLMTFGIKGGYDSAVKFHDSVNLFKRLVNIGDAKSLVCHPASTTHGQLSDEAKIAAGVHPEAIRLCVGIEHIDDIIADLEQALNA